MDREVLVTLACPGCGSKLELGEVFSSAQNEINHAIVKCSCRSFLIIAGILILNLDGQPKTEAAIYFLRKNSAQKALLTLLKSPFFVARVFSRIINSLDILHLPRAIKVIPFNYQARKTSGILFSRQPPLTFWETVKFYYRRGWANYLKFRFSSADFISLIPWINLLNRPENKEGYILDIASGMGHFSFMLAKHFEQKKIICVDREFRNLYWAKKYFVPAAQFICLNANTALPFKNEFFAGIFSLDTLHYIEDKRNFAQEIKRVMDPQGYAVFGHLHNALTANSYPGMPLTPAGYRELFYGLDLNLIPESKLVERLFTSNFFNPNETFGEGVLNNSKAILLIARKKYGPLHIGESFMDTYLKNPRKLVINPVYRVKARKNKLILTRRRNLKRYEMEYYPAGNYLPEICIVDKNILMLKEGAKLDESQLAQQVELMNKLILIQVPYYFK